MFFSVIANSPEAQKQPKSNIHWKLGLRFVSWRRRSAEGYNTVASRKRGRSAIGDLLHGRAQRFNQAGHALSAADRQKMDCEGPGASHAPVCGTNVTWKGCSRNPIRGIDRYRKKRLVDFVMTYFCIALQNRCFGRFIHSWKMT